MESAKAGAYLVPGSAKRAGECAVVVHGDYFSFPHEKQTSSRITGI